MYCTWGMLLYKRACVIPFHYCCVVNSNLTVLYVRVHLKCMCVRNTCNGKWLMYVCTCVYVYIHAYMCMYMRICVCTYVYVCVCVCDCVCCHCDTVLPPTLLCRQQNRIVHYRIVPDDDSGRLFLQVRNCLVPSTPPHSFHLLCTPGVPL